MARDLYDASLFDRIGFFVTMATSFILGAFAMLLYICAFGNGYILPLDAIIECITR